MQTEEQAHRAAAVALLAEGVDRNIDEHLVSILDILSPSSRRAWIEIRRVWASCSSRMAVALLAEGVDRNAADPEMRTTQSGSPSSRRAWIEIS